MIRAFRKFETKITFFPKKTSIIAIQSLKNVDCAILEKFVLFKGKSQRILVAVFFQKDYFREFGGKFKEQNLRF